MSDFTCASAQVSVLTRNYNNQRTAANVAETILNASNVNVNNFGRLFQVAVDDQVYSGILYTSNVIVSGVPRNVFFVATVNNSVYAFDADGGGTPLWYRNFNGSGRPTLNSEVGQTCGAVYTNFTGNIGIVGTPVIDAVTSTIFFITRTVEANTTVQRLRALDIATGNDRPNSPQVIQAHVPGTAEGNGSVVFKPLTQNQRAGLALSNGTVYIAWASYCDTYPFYGWVMAYDQTSLAQVGVFNTTPNGGFAGIWMGGGAPAFDTAGNLYVTSGNGAWDGVVNFGESVIKLAPRTLSVLDYFTPPNYTTLNSSDMDLGPSGPSFLPGSGMLIQGDKAGQIHLLNSANLGHLSGTAQIPQTLQAVDSTARPTATHHVHNSNVLWTSPQGLKLYVWGENDYLHSYRFNGTTFDFPAANVGAVLPPFGMPGGMMTVSANGSLPGTGILWASVPFSGDAQNSTVPGILYAFNAENLNLLWSSSAAADSMMNFPKYNPPVVANGKVYMASFSNAVSVYGLKTVQVTPPVLSINAGGAASGNFAADQYYQGGFTGTSPKAIDVSALSNPAPQSVYQTERAGNSLYTLPNLIPGATYTVRLHFAETYWWAAGQRIFNVSVNATQVLTNFDIVAAAGAASKAIVREFVATAGANGQIPVQFTTVTDNAKIDGIEVIAGGTGTPIPPAPTTPPVTAVIAINSGGPATGTFGADQYFQGGFTGTSNKVIDTSTVTNPAPQSVYQSERAGNILYTLPNLTAGATYTIRLHFAETYWWATGQRVFNVSVNGTQILTNFDVIAAAGAANRAVVREIVAIAGANGQIPVQFTTVIDNAAIEGIQVIAGGTGTPIPPIPVTPPVAAVIAINTGGAASGSFAADQYFQGGFTGSSNVVIDVSAVTNPAPQAVYQTERAGNVLYSLPGLTPNAPYTVRLHFAETYWWAAGQRIFNVTVNGTAALTNFDIIGAIGKPNKALVKEIAAKANAAGQIQIQFTSVVDNARIDGIEVVSSP